MTHFGHHQATDPAALIHSYSQLGFTATETLKWQSYNSILALFAQFLCIVFVDKLGRRWPLIFGNLVSCASYCCAAAIYAVYPGSVPNSAAHYSFIAMTWPAFSLGLSRFRC